MNLKKKEKIVKPVLKKLTEIVLNILSKKILNYAINVSSTHLKMPTIHHLQLLLFLIKFHLSL
ncbi:hypothetical protein BGV26_20010 [Clostridioides difficile]|nr:hypothetical protein BGV26_20010 [Clostridioides difficile]